MHFAIGVLLFIASIRWANWKEWERYYPTMIYIIASNLLYEFFALSKFPLWKFSSHDFFFDSYITINLWHVLIINSLFSFIYLSNFPEESLRKQAIYILKWVIICVLCEAVLFKFNYVNYSHGWHLGWTVFFDMGMFLMLRLHYKKPLWAIVLSVFFTLFYLYWFGYITK